MKIQWNKVTWYSKAIALAMFVLVSLGGFYFGFELGYLGGYADGGVWVASKTSPITQVSSTIDSYYQNIAEWQTSRNRSGSFSIAYPIDFLVGAYDLFTPSADWSFVNPNGASGNLFFTLEIPKAFEPQTNFDNAKLSVGQSANGKDIAQCLSPNVGGQPLSQATSTTTINGVNFVVFRISSAGAGNLYETTSYRTLHNGQCYAIEYTIHSSQLGNYPPGYHLQPFDEAKLKDVLDRIIGTFEFL